MTSFYVAKGANRFKYFSQLSVCSLKLLGKTNQTNKLIYLPSYF